MMERLRSTPPQTLGEFNPASRATSTNATGGIAPAGVAALAVSSRSEFFHFQSGAVSASRRALPNKMPEEPRKRRRRKFIACGHRKKNGSGAKRASESSGEARVLQYLSSLAHEPRKGMRHNSHAFLDGDDVVDRHVRQAIDAPAGPGDFQRIDFGALAQSKCNARIAGRHIAHPAFCLLDVHETLGS